MNNNRKKQVVGYKGSECQTNIWDSHALDVLASIAWATHTAKMNSTAEQKK